MREGIFAVGLLEISFTGVSWSLLYKAKAPATPSFKRVSLFSSTLTSAVKNNIILFPLKYRNIALAKQTCEDFIEFARWSMADKIRGYADLQGSRGAQLIINLAIFTIQQRWNQPWLVANNVSRNRKKNRSKTWSPSHLSKWFRVHRRLFTPIGILMTCSETDKNSQHNFKVEWNVSRQKPVVTRVYFTVNSLPFLGLISAPLRRRPFLCRHWELVLRVVKSLPTTALPFLPLSKLFNSFPHSGRPAVTRK